MCVWCAMSYGMCCVCVVWFVVWRLLCMCVVCGMQRAGVTVVRGGQKPTEHTRTCWCSSNRRKGRAPFEPLWGGPPAHAGQPDGGR